MIEYEVKRRWGGETQILSTPADVAAYVIAKDEYIDEIDSYDQEIDEDYGSIEIAGTRYYASDILREINEDKYFELARLIREGIAECDADYVEGEVESLSPGEQTTFQGGLIVTCMETCDDEEEETETELEGFDSVF